MNYEKLAIPDVVLMTPKGFAYAFYVTSDEAEFQYKCTDYFNPGDEYCIRWDDPALDIEWPLVNGQAPCVSEREAKGCYWGIAPNSLWEGKS